jgi:hypothetical protein
MEDNQVKKSNDKFIDIKEHIDKGFEYYSRVLNEKADELNTRISQVENKTIETLNGHISESAHENYVNICSEASKLNNVLRNKIRLFQYINIALMAAIVVLLVILVRG